MAKSSGRGLPGKKRGKAGGAPSTAQFGLAFAALAVLVVVYLKPWGQKKKPQPVASEPEDEEEELGGRFEAIRSALFNDDGSSAYSKGSNKESRFSHEDYWDERYAKMNKAYDWYGTWHTESAGPLTIKPHVKPWLPAKIDTVLNLGCGNSRIAEELYNDGFKDVMNIDISQTAIDKMSAKFAGISALKFTKMDMLQMSFADASFDFVLDKGTLDALYTGASDSVPTVVAQIFRVLKPGGLLVSMTFGTPKTRRELNMTTGLVGGPSGWDRHKMVLMKGELPAGSVDQQLYLYLMTKPLEPATASGEL